jgi:hypothetical protein
MSMEKTLKKLSKLDPLKIGSDEIEDNDVMSLAPEGNKGKAMKHKFDKSKLEAKEEMENLLAVTPK